MTPVAQNREEKEGVAPKRDFARVANSIVREAVPAGVFTGKGKHLYDYLYTQTRGAIVPVRSARLPTEKVMKGAGMTRHTFRAHVQRLIRFGLVHVEERPGEHGGNVYTVYLPEELETTDRGDRGDRGHTGELVPVVQGSLSDPCDRGLNPIDSTISGEPKTLIKTNTDDDDEAFAKMVAALRKTAKELTGREPSAAEGERWGELAELLSTELKIAAARTTVSNVPAFLTEHLRRRLWKTDKNPSKGLQTPGTAAPANVNECPDCRGTGLFYPEGFEKGVAKCRHEKLSSRAPKISEG